MTTAISLQGAGKRYVKYMDTPMLLTSALRFGRRTRRERLWALQNVDFQVDVGESVGVIGRNGSGKTTLMSLVAGITAPTTGSVRVWGRVAPLISVGVGFHRELTGRENIYLNAAILGLTRKETDRRLDEIIAFSEVESFIDTPVKFYSSGMFVRLGFSVAAHVDPDVLVVDEVLAVGDLGFQVKCFDRMNEIRARGTTLVMVSHNLAAVRKMCDRVLLLDKGRMQLVGPPDEAIGAFHRLMSAGTETVVEESGIQFEPNVVEITAVELLDEAGRPSAHFRAGSRVTAQIQGRALQDIDEFTAAMVLTAANGSVIYTDSNAGRPFGPARAGEAFTCTMEFEARLATGSYGLATRIDRSDLRTVLANHPPQAFFVDGRDTVAGLVDLGTEFNLAPALEDAVAATSDAKAG